MLYLMAKAPGDVVERTVEFFLDVQGDAINPVVEIIAAGNGESSIELEATAAEVVDSPLSASDSPRKTLVKFKLTGGTKDVNYKGSVHVEDNIESPPGTNLTKYFIITVKEG